MDFQQLYNQGPPVNTGLTNINNQIDNEKSAQRYSGIPLSTASLNAMMAGSQFQQEGVHLSNGMRAQNLSQYAGGQSLQNMLTSNGQIDIHTHPTMFGAPNGANGNVEFNPSSSNAIALGSNGLSGSLQNPSLMPSMYPLLLSNSGKIDPNTSRGKILHGNELASSASMGFQHPMSKAMSDDKLFSALSKLTNESTVDESSHSILNKATMSKDKGFNFPAKLHEILARKDISDIISWCPHGRAWKVFKPRVFEEKVIPQYFRHSKYNSFTRQVNGWGFKRITQGPDQNSYYHELFLRGAQNLCKRMRRLKVNTKAMGPTSKLDPDFYYMHKIAPIPDSEEGNSSSSIDVTPGPIPQNPRADFNLLNKNPESLGSSLPGYSGNTPNLMNQIQLFMNPAGNGNLPQDAASSQQFIQAQYLNAMSNMNSQYAALGNNAHFQFQSDSSKNSVQQKIIAQQALIASLQHSNDYNQPYFDGSIASAAATGSRDPHMVSLMGTGVPSIQFQGGQGNIENHRRNY